MVEVAVGRGGQLQGSEADVVEGLVVNTVRFVGVLNKLVDRQGGVVGLDNGVRHLGRGHDGVGVHDPVGILLPDLGDEECSHTRSSATSQAVGELESLQAVRGLGLLPDNI